MTEQKQRERVEREIVLAATQEPRRIGGAYVVSGWFCDLDSCACPDHEHTGATCKHMVAAAVWEARERRRAA